MKKLVRRKEMPDEDRTQLNPQIASVTIGVRTLRKINIYPLSLGDQLSTTNILTEAFVAIAGASDDVEVAGAAVKLIEQNFPLIIEFITDAEKDTAHEYLKDITNAQAVEIAEIVYEQNYASLIKKVKGLFERISKEMKKIPSKGPSQPSVSTTDIDSETSTEEDSEKAA
jgi:hypothetical protein